MDESKEFVRLLSVEKSDAEDHSKNDVERLRLKSLKGILAGLLLTVSHIIGVTSIQLLERRIPDLELQAFRSIAIITFCLVWMVYNFQSPKVPVSDIFATLLYTVVVTFQSIAAYMSFALTSSSAAQCSLTSVSLLGGLLIFALCGREKVGLAKVTFVVLSLAGVVLVFQPWHQHRNVQVTAVSEVSQNISVKQVCLSKLEVVCKLNVTTKCAEEIDVCGNFEQASRSKGMKTKGNLSWPDPANLQNKSEPCSSLRTCFGYSIDLSKNITKTNGTAQADLLLFKIPQEFVGTLGILIAGFGGLMIALLTFVIKRNPCLSEHRCKSLFWAFAACLVCSTMITFILEHPVWPETVFDMAAVLIHCVASVCTWFFVVYAMEHISGSIVSIIFSTSVIFFLIPQYTILASVMPGNKNWMEVVGVFRVLLGSVSASLYEIFCTCETNN